MAKFRKKPVVIEAVKFDKWNLAAVQAFVPDNCRIYANDGYVLIPTLEGEMRAFWGDYIIKGVQGEFYPCKPDIFEATYDSVSE